MGPLIRGAIVVFGVLTMLAGLASIVAVPNVGVAGLWTVAVGAFLVPAYNLELLGGRFHRDLWFGLAWGAFALRTG